MKILKRRKCSGFVDWPEEFGVRILSGRATYQTKCDMFIGPCSCGYTHRETDCITDELLESFGMELEIMVLRPRNGEVRIPKYWEDIDCSRRRCSHLMGACNCGKTHTGTEAFTEILLERHFTRIEHEDTDPS